MSDFGLSVIIPFHSRTADLSASLHALEKSFLDLSKKQSLDLEVIVVNDASPIPPGESRILPFRAVNLPENKGVSFARNAGIRAAKNERFLCLDADVLVPLNFFESVLTELKLNSQEPMIQGMLLIDQPGEKRGFFARYLAILNFAEYSTYLADGTHAQLFCSGCFLSTRSFLRTIGFFDEGFESSGGEEFEILRRLPRKAIFQSHLIQVHHDYEGILPRLRKIWRRSKNYASTAALNPNFPRAVKIAGCFRLIGALGVTLAIPLLLVAPAGGLWLSSACLLLLLFADGGVYFRYFWAHGGLILLMLTPIFLWLEYLVAGLGAVFHSAERALALEARHAE